MSNFTVLALRPCLRHHGQRRADLTGIRLGHEIAHDLRHGLKGRLRTLGMLIKVLTEFGESLGLLVKPPVDFGLCCRHCGSDLIIRPFGGLRRLL